MPRKARIDAPGALHHIIVRGIERKKIFRSDSDRKNLFGRLGDLVAETQTDCFAWVFMDNHHLLLRTGLVPIPRALCLRVTPSHLTGNTADMDNFFKIGTNRFCAKKILTSEN